MKNRPPDVGPGPQVVTGEVHPPALRSTGGWSGTVGLVEPRPLRSHAARLGWDVVSERVRRLWKSSGATRASKALVYGGNADVAQLVEHHLAKVRVAGSNPVVRSKEMQVEGLWRGMGGTHRLLMGSQWEDEIVGEGVCEASPSRPPGIPGRFAFSKVLVTLFAVRVLLDPAAGGRRR